MFAAVVENPLVLALNAYFEDLVRTVVTLDWCEIVIKLALGDRDLLGAEVEDALMGPGGLGSSRVEDLGEAWERDRLDSTSTTFRYYTVPVSGTIGMCL
ncbi:MAG: hypothetical protein ACLP6E_07045 [Acidimicrobiales bacterium]